MADPHRALDSDVSSSHAQSSWRRSNSSIQPRNRRRVDQSPTDLPSADSQPSTKCPSRSSSRSPGPAILSSHQANSARANASDQFNQVSARQPSPLSSLLSRPLLDNSWTSSWSSVQEFASTFLNPQNSTNNRSRSLGSSRLRSSNQWGDGARREPKSKPANWGPEPPPPWMHSGFHQIVNEPPEGHDSALRAAKTARVLDRHDTIDGELDALGRYKRRTSAEGCFPATRDVEYGDSIVYIHRVVSGDTLPRVMLRYKCREDALRRANGLWARDDVQVRSWLFVPVDACDFNSTPCEDCPSSIDIYPTGLLECGSMGPCATQATKVDTLSNWGIPAPPACEPCSEAPKSIVELPWVHVRWVHIESFGRPVEVGRISRRNVGYFPPRRKKSLHSLSTVSTPRQSTDQAGATGLAAEALLYGHDEAEARSEANATTTAFLPTSLRATETDEPRPGWMRRPGGVGSLGKAVSRPGPEGDYLNSWVKKHIPSFNMDTWPSMAITGSESASLSLNIPGNQAIVETPSSDEYATASSANHGSNIDRAAAAVEGWLRGALTLRPTTPVGSQRTRGRDESDLIELEDTTSEDCRVFAGPVSVGDRYPGRGAAGSAFSSASRPGLQGNLRGRSLEGTWKVKKVE